MQHKLLCHPISVSKTYQLTIMYLLTIHIHILFNNIWRFLWCTLTLLCVEWFWGASSADEEESLPESSSHSESELFSDSSSSSSLSLISCATAAPLELWVSPFPMSETSCVSRGDLFWELNDSFGATEAWLFWVDVGIAVSS